MAEKSNGQGEAEFSQAGRVDDINKAHVMAAGADQHAEIAARNRMAGEDDSWAQSVADRQVEEVGEAYDKKQAELNRDTSKLTREDEPPTRIDDEGKAEHMAYAAKRDMDQAAGEVPGGDRRRAEFKASKLASDDAEKLKSTRMGEREAERAGEEYDLAASQEPGRVDDPVKAEAMARAADHPMSYSIKAEKDREFTLSYIHAFEAFRDGKADKPPSGYEAYPRERMQELIDDAHAELEKLEKRRDKEREQADFQADVTGGKYDQEQKQNS